MYLNVKDEEKPGQTYIVGETVNWYNDFGKLPQYFLKLNIHIPPTSNSTPGYIPNRNECFCPPEVMDECIHSRFLHDNPPWKQPKCPSAVERINTL